MHKDKFEMILDKDENIKWCNSINTNAYVKKTFFKTLLFGFFPPFALLMLGVPYSLILLILSLLEIIPIWIGITHFIFSIIACLIFIVILKKEGNNTFCCITDKRIIKRSGAFNNKFTHYSLKNVGNILVSGGIFDTKGENASADLIVTVKDFHLNTNGNASVQKLLINSLNDAYDAYKLLSTIVEGYNEVIRVKNED